MCVYTGVFIQGISDGEVIVTTLRAVYGFSGAIKEGEMGISLSYGILYGIEDLEES